MQKARSYFKFFLIPFIFLTSSCLSYYDNHGYMFQDVDVSAVEVGFSDTRQVLDVFGSPTVTIYHKNDAEWIYLSEKVRNLLFFMPKVTERRVLVLSFDNGSVLSKVDEFSLSDQKKYDFDDEVTEISDRKEGFFDAIFGNIGQVTPQ